MEYSSGILPYVICSATPTLDDLSQEGMPVEAVAAPVYVPPTSSELTIASYRDVNFRQYLYQKVKSHTEEIANSLDYLDQYHRSGKQLEEVEARFDNVFCPRATAVSVQGKFIHANYVKDGDESRVFVASQYPMNKFLFWKFILEGSYDILDLYSGDEDCYPTQEKSVLLFDSIVVRLIEETPPLQIDTTRTYIIQDNATGQSLIMSCDHYTAWADHGSIEAPELHSLVGKLEHEFRRNTLVHCYAGVGRTGTLLTAYFLKQRIIKGEITAQNLATNLEELLISLRRQRGPKFLQTETQFNLLIDYAIMLLS